MYADETILPYGKYKNHKLKDIPREYLIDLWVSSKGGWDPEMREYLKENIARIKEIHWRTRGIGSKSSLRKNKAPNQMATFICNKRTFATEKAALESIIDRDKRKNGKTRPVRAYECHKCSGWHLSSKSLSEFKKTVSLYDKNKFKRN